MSRWNVADVMTIGAISVQEDTPFKEIVDLLEAHGINAVPVVDGFDRVVGIVSSADLVPKIEFAGVDEHVRLFENRHTRRARSKAQATAAGELMNAPAVTVMGTTSVVAAGLAAAYPLLLRRRCLTWGATADEVARVVPGDELLPRPDICSTRRGRAGAYTYDWIENLLGLDMHSAGGVRRSRVLRGGDGPAGPDCGAGGVPAAAGRKSRRHRSKSSARGARIAARWWCRPRRTR